MAYGYRVNRPKRGPSQIPKEITGPIKATYVRYVNGTPEFYAYVGKGLYHLNGFSGESGVRVTSRKILNSLQKLEV